MAGAPVLFADGATPSRGGSVLAILSVLGLLRMSPKTDKVARCEQPWASTTGVESSWFNPRGPVTHIVPTGFIHTPESLNVMVNL